MSFQTVQRIVASCPQHTEEGDLLGHLYYYNTKLLDVLNQEERYGYPHNGGEHTLVLRMKPADVEVWLELISEYYKKANSSIWDARVDAFIAHVRSKMYPPAVLAALALGK